MANEYMPRADAGFNGCLAHFVAYRNAKIARLELVAGDMAPVTTAQITWNTKYPAHVAAAAGGGGTLEGTMEGMR